MNILVPYLLSSNSTVVRAFAFYCNEYNIFGIGPPNKELLHLDVLVLDLPFFKVDPKEIERIALLGATVHYQTSKPGVTTEEFISGFLSTGDYGWVLPVWGDRDSNFFYGEGGNRGLPDFDKASIYSAAEGCGISVPALHRGWPSHKVIAKPSLGSGSVGVQVLNTEEEFIAFFVAKPESYNDCRGDYLIQDYVEGQNVTLIGSVVNGKAKIELDYDTFTENDRKVTTSVNLPSLHITARMEEQLLEFVKVLGLDNTLFAADFIVKDNKEYLIDFGTRMAGNVLTHMVRPKFLFNHFAHVKLGIPPNTHRRYNETWILRPFLPGAVTAAAKDVSVTVYAPTADVGEVCKVADVRKRGYVVVRAKTLEIAEAVYANLEHMERLSCMK